MDSNDTPDQGHVEALQFLDQLYNGSPTTTNTTEPNGASGEGSPVSSPEPPVDYEATITTLKDQLAKSQKQYNDVQSDIDRRVNVATKQATAELSAKLDTLTAALSGRSNPGFSPNGQTGQFDEEQSGNALPTQQQLAHLIRQEASRAAAELLNKDERVKAGKLVGDLAEFRAENPDSVQYDFLMQQAYKAFPHLRELGKEGMVQALNFSKSLIVGALEQAKAVEEAKKANQVNPQQPVKQPPAVASQRVSPIQAEELAARAAQINNSQGVSVSSDAKQTVDWNSVPNLETGVKQLTDMMLNRRR